MKFRKKPVEVEALTVADVLTAAAADEWQAMPDWLRQAHDAGRILVGADGVRIKTLEGEMLAEPDDWIIRGVKGEIYPCKPDIFAETYEPV